MKSWEKLVITISLAIAAVAIGALTCYNVAGLMVAVVFIIYGAYKHFLARCRKCESWKTFTEYYTAVEGGPGTVRYCKCCQHDECIDGSVLTVGHKDDSP